MRKSVGHISYIHVLLSHFTEMQKIVKSPSNVDMFGTDVVYFDCLEIEKQPSSFQTPQINKK